MADYRQSCMTPGCTYTGFSGHDDHCPYSSNYDRYQKRVREEAAMVEKGFVREDDYWDCRWCGSLVKDTDLHRKRCTEQSDVDRDEQFRREGEQRLRDDCNKVGKMRVVVISDINAEPWEAKAAYLFTNKYDATMWLHQHDWTEYFGYWSKDQERAAVYRVDFPGG